MHSVSCLRTGHLTDVPYCRDCYEANGRNDAASPSKVRGNRNWQRRYKQGVPRAAERRRLESATALVSSLPLLWLRAGNGSGAEMVLLLL